MYSQPLRDAQKELLLYQRVIQAEQLAPFHSVTIPVAFRLFMAYSNRPI